MSERETKMHWTQRPGGREKLSKAIKAGYRKKAKTSKAEQIIQTKVPRADAAAKRSAIYDRAVETAISAGEITLLSNRLSLAALRLVLDQERV